MNITELSIRRPVTTIMVFVMVAVAPILFTVADQIIRFFITLLLQIQT